MGRKKEKPITFDAASAAKTWAVRNGMKETVTASSPRLDGPLVVVEVTEYAGKKRTATCWFTADGKPSMWEMR